MTMLGRRSVVPPQAASPATGTGIDPRPGLRQRLRRRLDRTPGRLTAILVILVLLGLFTGMIAWTDVRTRATLIDGVTTRSGQLALAAQNLYRALSDADATAASGFLSGGAEPAELHERYRHDIADATAALAVVSAHVGPGAAAVAVGRITDRLPVYTGLVETARAYNRQGLPLGVAYLREASGLMRDELLPAAQELYRTVTDQLDDSRRAGSAIPWFALLFGVVTLAGLGYAQRYLTRRTNRVFNPGLVVATVTTVLLVTALGLSALTAAGHLRDSREHGSAQVQLLAEARIAGLQARADEALTLVARGNGAAFEADFAAMMHRLTGEDGSGGLLAGAQTAATDARTRQLVTAASARAAEWADTHRELRLLDENGSYAEAVALAVGTEGRTTADIFHDFDADLAEAIAHNGERFTASAERAGRSLAGIDIAVVVLTVLLVAGVALGLQRRILEYR